MQSFILTLSSIASIPSLLLLRSNPLGRVDESLYENSSDFPPVFSRERSADQVPKGSAYDKAQDTYMLQPK